MALVADFWRTQSWQVDIKPTEAAGHATILAKEASEAGHQMVIAAGGDGTLGEVTNGLAGSPTIMAPLPAGTSNSFAKELLMPRPGLLNKHRLLQAVDTLAAGRVQGLDLGYTPDAVAGDGRYWLLWAGVGADGYLVDHMEPRPKWSKRIGPAGYMLQGMFILPKAPPFQATVTIDENTYSGEYFLILISNARRYVGGIVDLSPDAQLDDGLFEVWLLEAGGVPLLAQYMVQAKWGDLAENMHVTKVNGRSITIQSEPVMPCQTDGDKSGNTPLSVHIKPCALQLLVPSTAPADMFCKPGTPLAEWVPEA
jgi:YegS/Rv2252/BmrU family lipid kinase